MTSARFAFLDRLPQNRLLGEFSLWSAALLRLADDLSRIEAHADLLHIDVADGHFAPALLFFPDLVAAIRKASRVPIHIHLMVADDQLLSQIDQFAEAGCDLISIHVENAAVANAALRRIHGHGVASGMVLKVETPVAEAARYLPQIDMLTLLGTAIGVKGQGLDERATARLDEARRLIEASDAGHRIVLAADGGIREHTVPLLRTAGAETVVMGFARFWRAGSCRPHGWLHGL